MIILICAKAGAGKTKIAHALIDHLPNTIIMSFADPLYEIHNITKEMLSSYGVELNNIERGLLIAIGEWGRKKDSRFWINLLNRKLCRFDGNIIIDDVRFPAELNAFPRAFKVKLEASLECRLKRAGKPFDPNDETETSLNHLPNDVYDCILDTENMSLESNVKYLLETLQIWSQGPADHLLS